MSVPKNIKVLPELADYLDPLEPETYEQLKAQIARDGLTDPICWAELTMPEGGTVNAPLDGHHRLRACKEVGAPVKWRQIESVHTIEEAKAWMFQRQDGRRNWSPNRRALYIAEAYEATKVDRGLRTDLHGGGKVDTAVTIGQQFGVSDKTVTDAAKLYRAIEALTDSLGIDARKAMLSHSPPANRDTLIELAEAPEDQRRPAWEALLKRDLAGARAILAKVNRVEQRKRPGLAGGKAEAHEATMDLYPLVDLVRLIGTKWPVERLEGWTPSYTEGEVLEVHAEAALRSLIWIASRYDWGQAALDDYLAENGQDARAPLAPASDGTLACSFCGKSNAEVAVLIKGDQACVCSECVTLCGDIIAEKAAQAAQEPETADDAAPETEAAPEAPEAAASYQPGQEVEVRERRGGKVVWIAGKIDSSAHDFPFAEPGSWWVNWPSDKGEAHGVRHERDIRPVAKPSEPEAAQEAVQRPLADRVADWAGGRSQKSAAAALGVSIPTYCKVLAGETVRSDARARIEAKLAR